MKSVRGKLCPIIRRKSFVILFFLLFCMPQLAGAQMEVFGRVPHFQTADVGVTGPLFSWNDSLFFRYYYFDNSALLGKFHKGRIDILTPYGKRPSLRGGTGFVAVDNHLFFFFDSSAVPDLTVRRHLARYNWHDSSVTIFPNPDNGFGFRPENTYQVGGHTYVTYEMASGKYALARIRKDGFDLVEAPENRSIGGYFGYGPANAYLTFSTWSPSRPEVLWLRFDGNSFQEITGRRDSTDAQSLVLFRGEQYFMGSNNGNRFLARIRDTAVDLMQYLPENFNLKGMLCVFDDKLWFQVVRGTNGEQDYMAYYDGDSIRLVTPNPGRKFDFANPVVYKEAVYFKSDSAPVSRLYRMLSNGSITQVPLQAPGAMAGIGSFEFMQVIHDKLYMNIYLDGYSSYGIASFDGIQLKPVIMPVPLLGVYPYVLPADKGVAAVSLSPPYNLLVTADTLLVPACGGTNVTIGSSFLGSSFQWQRWNGSAFESLSNNAIYQNTSTTNLSVINAPTSLGTELYRCVVDGIASPIYRIHFENRFRAGGPFVRSWSNPFFWSCGTLPDQNTHVVLPQGDILLNSNTTIRSLRMAPGVKLSIAPGIRLTVAQ